MKKFLIALLCLCLLASTAFAATKTPDGELPIFTDGPETFTAYMTDNTSYMYMDEKNRALQHYEEDTGIHLDIVLGDINLLMASGSYPELIFSAGFNGQQVYDYGLQGLVIPLNDLLDKHATFLKQAQEEYYPHMWEDWTSPDGNIYGIATSSSADGNNTTKMFINIKWLEDLGLEMPTTTAEFEDVLKAFKEYDTTVAPLTGAVNTWNAEVQYFLLNSYIVTDKGNYFLYQKEPGVIALAAAQDEFREGLAWANSLYTQGLIDPGAFTQELTDLQAYNADANNPHIGCAALGHKRMITESEGYSLDAWYDNVPPLKTEKGTAFTTWSDSGRTSGAQFCITDICHDPDAAMRYLNYWVTPENFFWNWIGDEGYNYVPAEEGQLNWKGEQAQINDVRWFPDFKYLDKDVNGLDMEACRLVQYPTTPWIYWNNAHAVQGPGVAEANWWKYDIMGNGLEGMKNKEFVGEFNLEEPLSRQPADEDQTATINQYGLALNNYINENIVAFIMGTKNVETDWDAYLAGLDGVGAPLFLETAQAAYDAGMFSK